MTVGFMGWLQRNTIQAAGGIAATKRCNRATKNSPCFAANSPPGRGEWNTNKSSSSQRIARGVACACVEPRRRDRLKATPSRRKTGQMASAQTHRRRNA